MVRRANSQNGNYVEALTYEEATHKSIPTAEYQLLIQKEEQGLPLVVERVGAPRRRFAALTNLRAVCRRRPSGEALNAL